MYRIYFFLILGLVMLAPRSIRAAEELLSLSRALNDGLKYHPDIVEADSELRIRLAQALAVSELPNPRFETEFRSLTSDPVIELKLMQPIKRSFFGLRQNYLVVERTSAEAASQAKIAGVLNDVYSRYIALWAVQEFHEIRDANREDFKSLLIGIERAITAGQRNPLDAMLLKAELAAETVEHSALDAQRLALSALLAQSIGRTDGLVIRVETPAQFPIPDTSGILEEFAINRTPLRVALAKQEEAALARLAISRTDRLGGTEVGLVGDHDTETGSSTLGVGFSMNLPIWNKNEAAIAAAQADVDAARNNLTLIEPSRVASFVKLRYKSALASEQAARDYSRNVIPKFTDALDGARNALEKGQGDISQIQIVVSRITETRLRAFELRISALKARAELEAAIGGRLEEALAESVDN